MEDKPCRICGSRKRVTSGHELICTCGVVCDIVEQTNIGPVFDSPKLGSKNPIDPKLHLEHINKEKTSRIIQHNDQYLNNFTACCAVLKLNESVTRSAIFMFKKLRSKKLGTGKTAAFAIHQACIDAGIISDDEQIINIVRARFNLKRYFNMRAAIYAIKPTAQDMQLVNTKSLPDTYYIRKYVQSKNYRIAVKIMDMCTSKKVEKKAKIAQEYLSSLG